MSAMAMLRQPRCRETRPEGVSTRSQQQSCFPTRVAEKDMAVFFFHAQIAIESSLGELCRSLLCVPSIGSNISGIFCAEKARWTEYSAKTRCCRN